MQRELPRAGMLLLLAAAFAALEWAPDPLDAADLTARAAAGADDACEGPAALLQAQEASASAPRRALPHLLVAALARDHKLDAIAQEEIDRAAHAEPCRGPVQAVVANDRLIDAVVAHDRARLPDAARAFAAAVATGAISCLDAYDSLRAAEAPADCYDLVAGRDSERLEALVEHHAFALATVDALSVADRLDSLRGDGTRRARAGGAAPRRRLLRRRPRGRGGRPLPRRRFAAREARRLRSRSRRRPLCCWRRHRRSDAPAPRSRRG